MAPLPLPFQKHQGGQANILITVPILLTKFVLQAGRTGAANFGTALPTTRLLHPLSRGCEGGPNLPRGARNSGVRKRLGGGQRGPCSPSSRARVPGPCRASLPRASLPRATSTAWLRTVHFWGYVHGGGPPNPPAMKSA